jgi:glycosyltransferase involved in cell wall biosynthesis
MAACDVFVLNSTHEAFPHVVLEAMSVGLPAIATRVGGTPEIVEERVNGLLMTSLDRDPLGKALAEVISSPLMRQSMATAALRSTDRFSFRRMADVTESVLSATILGGR